MNGIVIDNRFIYRVFCCVILNLHCDHVNGATWLGYQFALFITANGLSRHLCIQLRAS